MSQFKNVSQFFGLAQIGYNLDSKGFIIPKYKHDDYVQVKGRPDIHGYIVSIQTSSLPYDTRPNTYCINNVIHSDIQSPAFLNIEEHQLERIEPRPSPNGYIRVDPNSIPKLIFTKIVL